MSSQTGDHLSQTSQSDPAWRDGIINLDDDEVSVVESAGHSRSFEPSRQSSPVSQSGRKRKRADNPILEIDSDEDVQVISEQPQAGASARAQSRFEPRETVKATTADQPDPYMDAIDLDSLPDIRPRSPPRARNGEYNYNGQDLVNMYRSNHDYGSAYRPIEVDDSNESMSGGQYAAGPSYVQHVNGNAVGSFQNGHYIPYRSAGEPFVAGQSSLPYRVPGSYPPDDPETSSLSNLYDRIFGNTQFLRDTIYDQYNQRRLPPSFHVDGGRPGFYDPVNARDTLTQDDLKNLLANISDMDIPPEKRVDNPEGLTKSLMAHQRIGLTWLLSTEAGSNKGGILADAMGLGKTIQAIALILSRPSEDSACKSTLVVAPVALLRQWAREIRIMTSPTPSIYIHHGAKKLSDSKRIAKYDVVLTSFNTLGFEAAMRDPDKQEASRDTPLCPILDVDWYRVILDEAHYIKNKKTKSAKGCCQLAAMYRWALTGTPMQNSLDELYSLINFLQIKPYSEYQLFEKDIIKPISRRGGDSKNATQKLQALLTAIMLRRTKDSKIDGKFILELPAKHNIVNEVTMAEDERTLYTQIQTGAQKTLQHVMKHASKATGSNVLVLLLRLRQACDHFALVDKEQKEITVLSKAKGIEIARSLRPEIVDRLKTTFMEDGTECSICQDIATGITILTPCGHFYCNDCLIQVIEAPRFDEDDAVASKCPQCRNPFDLEKCINLKHFRAAHCPEQFEHLPKVELAEADTNVTSNRTTKTEDAPYSLNIMDKGKSKQNCKRSHDEFLDVEAAPDYKQEFIPSAKIQMIESLLLEVHNTHPGQKTIVFSQFTSFLSLIEIPLRQRGLRFLRYDGSLNAEQRNTALVTFENDPRYNIILISLKAGNVGLNLTCANHVIISEPFWNPYVEDQAIDRAHRIGQQKEVFVHRLIVKDSVESRVLSIQEKKREVIEGAMDPTSSAAITKLDKKEIAFLFGI